MNNEIKNVLLIGKTNSTKSVCLLSFFKEYSDTTIQLERSEKFSFGEEIRYLLKIIKHTPSADLIYLLPMSGYTDYFAVILGFIFRKKIVTDFYISKYEMHVVDRQKFKRNSPISLFLKTLERLVIKLSDANIFLSHAEKKYYLSVLGCEDSEKNFVIPWFITNKLKDIGTTKEKSIFNLCWWGSYVPLHGIENLIEGLKILRTIRSDFKVFLYVLKDPFFEKLEKQLQIENLTDFINIRFDLNFKNGLEEEIRRECDIALGSFGTSEKAKNVILNKAIEASVLEKPIITRYSQGLSEYLGQDEAFYISISPEEIARSIDKILTSGNYSTVGKKAHDSISRSFQKEKFYSSMNSLLQKI